MAALYATQPKPTTLPTHELLGGFKPDESVEHQVQSISQNWLSSFEVASKTNDAAAFAELFAEDSFWRDIIAFTNDYRTLRGPNIAQAAKDRLALVGARDLVFAKTQPTLQHPFEDVSFINIHFDFATNLGPSYGIANLVRCPDGKWRAYLLFTLLEGIHEHPELVGANRLRGTHNDKESYDTRRAEEGEFKDEEPSVLIVGAGHNGLSLAARLKALGTNALVIDKQKRTGDNWRLRYKSLSLHDPVYANHLAYMPFPANWPIFTPAGKLANWMEHYVDVLELNVWNDTVMLPDESDYDPATKRWNVTLQRGDGSKRQFSVTHVVLATGLGGGKPKMPAPFPGQETFTGKLVHSSGHGSGAEWTGQKALVVGACTSAHDISLDLVNNGADTTMLQRSPTYVMSVKNGMPMMMGNLFCEGGPDIDLADKMAESTPKFVVKLMHERIIPKLALLDKELLDGLAKAGFQTTLGPENSGFITMALEKAGGYYFDTGASGKIASGDIKVKAGEIERFEGPNVIFKDGTTAQPDTVVFATGYTGFPDTVRATLGTKWTKNMSTVWSLDEEGELKGASRESGIPSMYFLVGNLSAARLNSKVVALQIKAQQLGLFGERYTMERQAKGQANGVH